MDDGIRVQVRSILQSELTVIKYRCYLKVGTQMDDLIKLIPLKFPKKLFLMIMFHWIVSPFVQVGVVK